jgi:photosystem II stability/assembly factor-like uncharacterized protein
LYRLIGLIGLFLSFAITASSSAETVSNQPALPFTLSWTSGVCPSCETAQNLSQIKFVSLTEAWGIGFRPPGETGEGDYSIIHTRDGGKTWTELPNTYSHNITPSISFPNRVEGWIKVFDINEADDRIMQTRDGGAHWHRLPLQDLFITDIEYLGNGIGHAFTFDPYKKNGDLLTTEDFGRHWRKAPLPIGFSGEHLAFMDASRGVLTGCLEHGTLVIKTEDVGQNWRQIQLDLPQSDRKKDASCELETDGLGFLGVQTGWVLVNKHSFMSGDLTSFGEVLQTSDGGATWTKTFQTTSPSEQLELSEARFLTPQLGFISKSDNPNNGQENQTDSQHDLLYTVDGGKTWNETKLVKRFWGCRPFLGDLICATDDRGFSFVRISPAGAP